MKVSAYFNVKGGVGKTTSAVNVAHILAAEHKKKVLLIDLDPQSNATRFFDLYNKTPYHVGNVLLGSGRQSDGKEVPVTISDCICHTAYENLDVIPSHITLGRVERALLMDTTTVQQFKLRTQLQTIKDIYDYVLIDCHPSAESLINTNGLAAADEVFVPLKVDEFSIDGLDYTLNIIDTIKNFNPNLTFGGAFLVQYEKRNRVDQQVIDLLHDAIKDSLIPIAIRKSTNIKEISFAHIPICAYAKKDGIAEDYRNLTSYIYSL